MMNHDAAPTRRGCFFCVSVILRLAKASGMNHTFPAEAGLRIGDVGGRTCVRPPTSSTNFHPALAGYLRLVRFAFLSAVASREGGSEMKVAVELEVFFI